jgi:4-carboxymuconolactone decarboxylase
MARIPLPTPETMSPAQRAVHDRVVAGPRGALRGPLRAALLNPELAERWQALGELLRYNTSLSPRHSELAILVTGRHCRAPFEWHVHRIEAEKAGLEPAVIEAILAGTRPHFSEPKDEVVFDFARELNVHDAVSTPVYQRLLDNLGALSAVELTALVGYYTMVAMTLNAHQIPLPEGAVAAFEPGLV